ncbi:MAG: hypothetical protein V1808_02590 [Candidatus Daviesbacteria bacterium]
MKTNQKVSPHKCNDCGCDLILIEETTAIHGNNLYPITRSVYICSNKECQAEADKRTATRIALKKEQEESRQRRTAENLKLQAQKSA